MYLNLNLNVTFIYQKKNYNK